MDGQSWGSRMHSVRRYTYSTYHTYYTYSAHRPFTTLIHYPSFTAPHSLPCTGAPLIRQWVPPSPPLCTGVFLHSARRSTLGYDTALPAVDVWS